MENIEGGHGLNILTRTGRRVRNIARETSISSTAWGSDDCLG